MGALKGNKNAVGNRGGGRKSAYQELADAQDLHDLWLKVHDRKALQKKINKGKYSVKEVFAAKALGGDMSAINKLLDKIFPNWSIIDQHNYNINENDPLDTEALEPRPKKKVKRRRKVKLKKKVKKKTNESNKI